MFLQVDAVLFDLDETLIDSFKGQQAAHIEVSKMLISSLKLRGIQVNFQDLLRQVSDFDDEMEVKLIRERDNWWPTLFRMLGGRRLSKKTAQRLTKAYWTAYANNSPPYEDAIPTLEYLRSKGYKIGLVTDTDGTPGMKRWRVALTGLEKYVDAVVVGGEDIMERKPSPELFLLAARRLGAPAERCLMVGDKAFVDIKGAIAAGMKAILIHRREWDIPLKPHHTIHRLAELRSLL
ncbi:MAG: putative HAD-hydrolase [Candidatus Bathyarchaeota archaeon BA1]|nr:MAG: putative HAD-hydrolase [Candidatus Bathyarchaeota archaeon BA1]